MTSVASTQTPRAGAFAWTAAVSTAVRAWRRQRAFSVAGKNALVTGGARGLGLEIARTLAGRGANVAVAARDEAELTRAVLELQHARGSQDVRIVAVPCDLCVADDITKLLAEVRRTLGPIDVLVNNAGAIQVGPLAAMSVADYERSMQLHCFAALRTMLGVRDEMRERGGGRIANIVSIGGIVAVPHLAPYSTSKFALMGLSQGMHCELAREGIVVSTVAPGLMRTGSPYRASFKGAHDKEFAWFAVSDSIPGLSMASARAARRIVEAIEHGDAYVVLGLPAKLAAIASALAPNWVAGLTRLANELLPEGDDPNERLGVDCQSELAPRALTWTSERAAQRNNELGS
jgi:short-subunit dehydrogenase